MGNKELTSRQKEILVMMSKGLSTKMVATDLKVSVRVIEHHKAQITEKLGAGHFPHAIAEAIRRKIIK